LSGTVWGGAGFGGSTTLTLRSTKVVVQGNDLAIGFGNTGGNDTDFFVSGTIGSKNTSTAGVALFNGDVVTSGSFYGTACIFKQTTTTAASYTVSSTDHTVFCDATSNAVTASLPASAGVNTGRILCIKKVDSSANGVLIQANGAENVEGNNTKTLAVQYASALIQSDGTQWFILAS